VTGQLYRLNTADGHNLPVTVPSGSIVQVKNGPLDGERLIDVVWDGRTVSMFTIDLRDRGECVGDLPGNNLVASTAASADNMRSAPVQQSPALPVESGLVERRVPRRRLR
jgi:hypothetical protein